MARPQPVSFGRRNAAPSGPLPGAAPPSAADTAAFFAAVRAEQEAREVERPVEVRSAPGAGLIAGLVTGCALAGFTIARPEAAVHLPPPLAAFNVDLHAPQLLLPVLFISLLGAARVTAFSVYIAHRLLKAAGRTDVLSYAVAGAAVAALGAGLLALVFDEPPAHGWTVELLAGAGAAAFYRMLAGTHRRGG